MTTNTNASTNADTNVNTGTVKDADNATMTPVRKGETRSGSMSAMDAPAPTPTRMPASLATPIKSNVRNNNNNDIKCSDTMSDKTEHKIGIRSEDSDDIATGIGTGDSDSGLAHSKSVSFEYEPFENEVENTRQNTIHDHSKKNEQDADGRYLNTSSFDETPDRRQHRSTSMNEGISNADANENADANANTGNVSGSGSGSGAEKAEYSEEFRRHQEGRAALSIPELAMGKIAEQNDNYGNKNNDDVPTKRRIAFSSEHGSRLRNSFVSEISSESEDDDDDNFSFFDVPESSRDETFKRLQLGQNRRGSLTVAMETGRSPGGVSSQFHLGQHAMRRSCSNNMLDAQSPRVRRRRQLSNNIDQLRRGLLNNVEQLKSKRLLSSPPVKTTTTAIHSDEQKNQIFRKGYSEDEFALGGLEGVDSPLQQQQRLKTSSFDRSRSKSVRLTDRNRRNRYNVEKKSVRVPNDEQSRNYHDEMQYRLSALTPVELRRRRYRSSRGSRSTHSNNTGIRDNIIDNGSGIDADKNNDGNKNSSSSSSSISNYDNDNSDGKYSKWLTSVGNFIAELTISTLSQGKPNHSTGWVNKYLYWTFRKNLFVVLLSAACMFYLVTVIFAVFIYLIGVHNPKCIHVNGVDFEKTKTQFMDAFALSWTTFSTVGYGLVYPGTSATLPEEFNVAKECTGIAIVTTMEAFVGILFAGIWGAIFFAKVTRVASFAQVSFSDAIIIKYGTGVTGMIDDDEYQDGSSDDDDPNFISVNSYKQSKLPCPFFEFRVANRLHRQRGGEIIDASINIVASMNESQAGQSIRKNGDGMGGMRPRRKGKKAKRERPKRRNKKFKLNDGDNNEINEATIKKAQEAAKGMIMAYTANTAKAASMTLTTMGDDMNDDEEQQKQEQKLPTENNNSNNSNSNNIQSIPHRIFAKLHVESQEHPFFKRVWNVRHVLDHTSPLLKPEVKELIRINKGRWPEELNSATAVRASIHFDQILVSFSGTSNVDANSVYSQKAYDFADVCVGYAFCNMLFRESNGSIGVDHKLLNDVKEQSGGGGEELDLRDVDTKNRDLPDILIL